MIYDNPPNVVPSVVFKTRVRDETITGPNPYRWEDTTSFDYFGGKRVILFALPGAFTPTCSDHQLPGYERMYDEFLAQGIDEIYCLSVNDAFVMNVWAKSQNIEKVKMIPDGSGHFTRGMHMAVFKDNLGFGYRSWRYAVVVNNGSIEKWFTEPDRGNNTETDPYGESSPETVLTWLQSQ